VRVLALADQPSPGDPTSLARRAGAEAVVCLGDLQVSWIETLDSLQLPKVGVYGNHDVEPYLDWFAIDNAHLRRVEVARGLTVCGFEGCVRYTRSGHDRSGPMYTQKQAGKLIRKLPPADVLICHCPPRGVNDDPGDPAHVGWDALLDWVLEHRPRTLLHGHTYPQPGELVARLGDTRVVYVRGAAIVELP
jgi:Icc-related predicted phosphoesterase